MGINCALVRCICSDAFLSGLVKGFGALGKLLGGAATICETAIGLRLLDVATNIAPPSAGYSDKESFYFA